MLNNQLRRQLLERHKQSGFPGSIIDVYKAYEQGVDIISNFEQQQMQQQMQVAQTPQQQQAGLRPFHQAGNTSQSMVFPNVPPNTPFNTVGMKAPINIEKYDKQGHLVKSYENVPPGIENLPTGPSEGTVIETPANMQSGGQLAPIYTNNPRDSRLQAYNDSLHLYNRTRDIENPRYYDDGTPSWYGFRGTAEEAENFARRNNIDYDYEYYRTGRFPGEIQPIDTRDWGEGMDYPIYKRPVQPVIYRELAPLTPKAAPSNIYPSKELRESNVALPKPSKRAPQPIMRADFSKGIARQGQYQIGERYWDDDKKRWKENRWSPEEIKESKRIAIEGLKPPGEYIGRFEFGYGGKRKYQSGNSPEEADKIYTRLNSPIDPSTTNLLDPAYVYGDTQNKFFKPTEDPERLRVREILGEPLKALAYYSYDSNRKRGRPTRAEWNAFGRSNAMDQALSLVNPFQIINDAATSEAGALSLLPDIGNAPKNLLENITNQVFKKKYYPDIDFKSMSAAQQREFFRNQEQLEAEDAVKSGAKWLEDWINHPATKQRILNVTTPDEYVPSYNLIKPIQGMSLNPTYNVHQTPQEFLLNYPKLFEGTKHAETLGIVPISRKTFDQLPKDLQSAPIHGVSRRHDREAREISPWSKKDVNTYVIDSRAPTKRPNNRLSDNLHALLTSRTRAINKGILTTIHEGTHDWANDQVVEDIIKNTSTPNPWGVVVDQSSNIFARHLSPETLDILQKGNNRHIKYLSDPTEIHARVMELRRMMNIHPDQIVTADDVAKMVSRNEKTKYIDPKFFEIFAGKGADKNKNIAELFNVLPAAIVGGVGVGIMGANSNAKQENSPSGVLSPSTGLKTGGFKYPRYPKKCHIITKEVINYYS